MGADALHWVDGLAHNDNLLWRRSALRAVAGELLGRTGVR